MEIGSEVHIDIFDDRMEVYSPGGMFDGSIVQELDTDNVASKRRNPVIADIFSRMHFMEQRFQEDQGRLSPCGQLPSRSRADVQIDTHIIFCYALQSELQCSN